MKTKAMLVVLVCVLGIAVFSIGTAGAVATPPWYNVTITNIGMMASQNFYWVVCTSNEGAFTGSMAFIIDAGGTHAKENLATILTAYASGGTASLYIPTLTSWTWATYVGAGTYPY